RKRRMIGSSLRGQLCHELGRSSSLESRYGRILASRPERSRGCAGWQTIDRGQAPRMKRRRAHHDIEGIFKRKLQKVTSHQAYSRSKLRGEMLASRVQHFWGKSTPIACPRGTASIHSAVRRPVPHPASSTTSSPRRRNRDSSLIAPTDLGSG